MTEKEKMLLNLPYNPNVDKLLIKERNKVKTLCQDYNHAAIEDLEKRKHILEQIFQKTLCNVLIEPYFWCDYGYNISLGENFYANHGLTILDAGKVSFGDNVFVGPNCSFYTSSHPLEAELRNTGLEYAYPIIVGNNVWFGGGVQVLPGVTIEIT